MDIDRGALASGRAAFDAADWRTAYDLLTGIDETTPLAAEDLDRVAEAAMWVGEHQACIAFGQRAFAAWESVGEVRHAASAARVRWRKRVWSCPEVDCEVVTWTEQSELAGPRRVLTMRAECWATDRVGAIEGTPASIAWGFGVSWSTVWA